MNHQPAIREEELKNRVASVYFGRFDSTRIVGNIDFCVLPKRRAQGACRADRAEGLRIWISETMTEKENQ